MFRVWETKPWVCHWYILDEESTYRKREDDSWGEHENSPLRSLNFDFLEIKKHSNSPLHTNLKKVNPKSYKYKDSIMEKSRRKLLRFDHFWSGYVSKRCFASFCWFFQPLLLKSMAKWVDVSFFSIFHEKWDFFFFIFEPFLA